MNVLYFWGPVMAVMGLIFYTSSLSNPGSPPADLSDKAAHVIVYAALGAALVRALAKGRVEAMTRRCVWLAFAIGTLYGVSDEIHQRFVPHRTPELLDVLADASGVLVGAVMLVAVARALRRLLSAG